MTNTMIKTLCGEGAKRWTKGNYDRLYLNGIPFDNIALNGYIDLTNDSVHGNMPMMVDAIQRWVDAVLYDEPDDYYDDRDYSPSNPWDAPGMKISDFISGVRMW